MQVFCQTSQARASRKRGLQFFGPRPAAEGHRQRRRNGFCHRGGGTRGQAAGSRRRLPPLWILRAELCLHQRRRPHLPLHGGPNFGPERLGAAERLGPAGQVHGGPAGPNPQQHHLPPGGNGVHLLPGLADEGTGLCRFRDHPLSALQVCQLLELLPAAPAAEEARAEEGRKRAGLHHQQADSEFSLRPAGHGVQQLRPGPADHGREPVQDQKDQAGPPVEQEPQPAGHRQDETEKGKKSREAEAGRGGRGRCSPISRRRGCRGKRGG